MPETKQVSVSDIIDQQYREYWEYSNSNGKNAIDAREQLPEVVRKIIFACYNLKVREHEERKTAEIIGETAKYHPHGSSSIEDSIKGVATAYKSQPATRILEGIGNFGSAPGDEGAAGRYTSVSGTPLLAAIYRDIPFVPLSTDDTGLPQPEYISCPLPMAVINGHSPIGTGRSCYVGEYGAQEVIEWVDQLRKKGWDEAKAKRPNPMSVTGCETWLEPSNGYIYYRAVVHESVDMNDLSKRGKWDVITNLPPKSTPDGVIYKLVNKLPTRISKQVKDGSGKGKPLWILVPHGYLDERDYAKYGMQNARKENIYVWDHEAHTMRSTTLAGVLHEWFDDRCMVVSKRLENDLKNSENLVHKIDLIREYAESDMQHEKDMDKVLRYFQKLHPETYQEDVQMLLDTRERAFRPENLAKNEEERKHQLEVQDGIKNKLKNIGDVVIDEAFSIIRLQEKFFS